jgi:hypothetical protein
MRGARLPDLRDQDGQKSVPHPSLTLHLTEAFCFTPVREPFDVIGNLSQKKKYALQWRVPK